jgi:hypothetical protein
VNDPGIFVAGVIVVVIVAAALGLLVWGLRMEARQNRLRDEEAPNGVVRALERHPERPRQKAQ